MPASVMSPVKSISARMPREHTPQEIISSARNAPAGMRGPLIASGLCALLMWGAFTPLDFGPLAWLCLVPLLTLVRVERPPRRMYLAVYLGGLSFWVSCLQWMRLGDPTMYAAWGALAIYLALYFPLFVRAVSRRRLEIARAAHLVGPDRLGGARIIARIPDDRI